MRNKQLGQVKYQLNRLKGIELKDIIIDRRKGTVKVGNDVVAKFDDDDDITYEGLAMEVKADVEEYMKGWLSRRSK